MSALRFPDLHRALHRDQHGFLSPLIIFMLVALAYMIVWILDTGQMIYDKQRTQDTADAAALVHADWEARSLNVMAMNNVASSQATVIMVTSAAYAATMAELLARSTTIGTMLTRFSGTNGWGDPRPVLPTGSPYCPIWGDIPLVGGILEGACVAFQVARGVGALDVVRYVTVSTIKYEPNGPVPGLLLPPNGLVLKAQKIIRAMNAMNDYLVESFPERVGNEALHLVKLDEADHVVFHPACTDSSKPCREGQGGDLPVERGTAERALAFQEMCRVMSDGTTGVKVGPIAAQSQAEYAKRGFPAGKGPFSGGGVDGRPIRDFVNDESGIGKELHFFHEWYEGFGPGYMTGLPVRSVLEDLIGPQKINILGVKIDVTDEVLDLGLEGAEKLFGIKAGIFNPFQYPIDAPWPRYSDSQTKEKNDFTRKFDTAWNGVCGAGGIGGTLMSMLDVLPKPYWLKGRKPVPSTIADGVVTRTTGDQKTAYRVLAVVSRKPRARLQTARFVDKTPSAYATAESWVHNYTSFDLYTQDWLAALAPTSLMNNAQAVSGTIKKSPAAASYSTLTRALDGGGSGAWSQVNAH